MLTAIGGIIAAFLASNPEIVGDPEITRVGILVVVFLVAIGLLRLLVRAIVYTRTTYEVTEDRVRSPSNCSTVDARNRSRTTSSGATSSPRTDSRPSWATGR